MLIHSQRNTYINEGRAVYVRKLPLIHRKSNLKKFFEYLVYFISGVMMNRSALLTAVVFATFCLYVSANPLGQAKQEANAVVRILFCLFSCFISLAEVYDENL